MTRWQKYGRPGWLAATVSLFLSLAVYQLGLPGLHYDEAKEAGVNAMELLHRAPVTAFRGATVSLLGTDLPLMVQDYIGALNVYLALPFLAITGIGVPNLRLLPLLLAVLGLLVLERTVSEWLALCDRNPARTAPIAPAALVCLTLLAAAPSFVFWQRQGIFITNATFPFTFACMWQSLHWLRRGQARSLILAALCAGFALYAKLLAAWIILPFSLACAGWWLWQRPSVPRQSKRVRTSFRHPRVLFPLAALAFFLPLTPLFLFNLQTGGTLSSLTQNFGSSYYGVNNAAILSNANVRWQQLLQTLTGSHFWYLGAVHQSPLAPWLSLALPAAALARSTGRRMVGPPLLLLIMAFAASLFTISDLFVTHYALLHPLAIAVTSLALCELWHWFASKGRAEAGKALPLHDRGGPWIVLLQSMLRRPPFRDVAKVPALQLLLALLVSTCFLLDLRATAAYHAALSRSGGLVDHSDAIYHLAYDLRYGGLGAPIVMDWGLEAPIRFLSAGTVSPIEIFGYASLLKPDESFTLKLETFLDNPGNTYLLRSPGNGLFQGRRAEFERLIEARNGRLLREQVYSQRDGTPLYERWRVSY
ncbi:MAG: hypothetical protein OXF62_16380 [Caldilineaceae bacterium]|nr:hypothetical protein [Caldilineaceae bacterium]